MSDGSESQACGAATGNARRANSVRVLAADSSAASEDRKDQRGTRHCYVHSLVTDTPKNVVDSLFEFILIGDGLVLLPSWF